MGLSVYAGGGLRSISSFKIKIGGALRTVRTGKVMVGDVLRTFYSSAAGLSLSLSLSQSAVTATSHTSTATTATVTATPAGGVGPFSYAWTIVSSEGNTPTIAAPAFASTAFSQASAESGDEFNDCSFRCTATDSLGATATADITVHFRFIGLS